MTRRYKRCQTCDGTRVKDGQPCPECIPKRNPHKFEAISKKPVTFQHVEKQQRQRAQGRGA